MIIYIKHHVNAEPLSTDVGMHDPGLGHGQQWAGARKR